MNTIQLRTAVPYEDRFDYALISNKEQYPDLIFHSVVREVEDNQYCLEIFRCYIDDDDDEYLLQNAEDKPIVSLTFFARDANNKRGFICAFFEVLSEMDLAKMDKLNDALKECAEDVIQHSGKA